VGGRTDRSTAGTVAPVQPLLPPTSWQFPDPSTADRAGVVAVGADLEPGTLLAAYRRGLFPMRLEANGPVAWWSPDPRAIIPLDGLRVSRSLAKSVRRYPTTVDQAFREVMTRCADPDRPHGWITDDFIDAYVRLHELGWAHSIETWHDGVLVGGLYGVSIGGLFAGESMFHTARDASKVALVRLVEILSPIEGALLDVQWHTDHLASLGAVEVPRERYLELLEVACRVPSPL
jgi:leucyl/phenylalanyl-tRNA--protein transferase